MLLMGQSTISMAIFQFAFCLFTIRKPQFLSDISNAFHYGETNSLSIWKVFFFGRYGIWLIHWLHVNNPMIPLSKCLDPLVNHDFSPWNNLKKSINSEQNLDQFSIFSQAASAKTLYNSTSSGPSVSFILQSFQAKRGTHQSQILLLGRWGDEIPTGR